MSIPGAVTTVLSHSMAAQLGINENTPGAKVDLGIAGVGGFEGVVLKVPNVTFKTREEYGNLSTGRVDRSETDLENDRNRSVGSRRL